MYFLMQEHQAAVVDLEVDEVVDAGEGLVDGEEVIEAEEADGVCLQLFDR